MIDVKKRLPQVYSQSYDMSIFTGLLNLIYNSRAVDNLRAKVSHCPLHCFDEDVPRLASLFGLPTSATRDILSTYRRLIKIKGTSTAVQKAVLAPSKFTLQDLSVLKDVNNPSYTYTLPDLTDYDWDLFFSLLHRLAPVNTVVSVEPTLKGFIIPIKGEGSQSGYNFPVLSDFALKPITPIARKLVTGNTGNHQTTNEEHTFQYSLEKKDYLTPSENPTE